GARRAEHVAWSRSLVAAQTERKFAECSTARYQQQLRHAGDDAQSESSNSRNAGAMAGLNLRKARLGRRPDFAIGPRVEYTDRERTYGFGATVALPLWNQSQ